MEVEIPVEKIEVASVESEPEPVETTSESNEKESLDQPAKEQTEPKEEVKEEVKEEPKEETKKETKEEPKKEVKVEPKKEVKPKTRQQKKEDKQKAGTKIVKKMGNKGRYDSTNQLKTLIVMNVIADTKSFFSAQKLQKDIPGFFSSATVPDAVLSDNNIAAYLLMVGSSQKINNLINSQYE
jgi:outer membrane biosynthesis protein TonB